MVALPSHEFHAGLNAAFGELNGKEIVVHYGDVLAEHGALHDSAGVLDLSFRSRICLLGADRQKFINGQVTNNVRDLEPGGGCYAALITAKGKMQSDLNIYVLENEILLDFEPGLTEAVTQRLEKYVIADDVQFVDVTPHYGLLSVQGPQSSKVIERLELNLRLPERPMQFTAVQHETVGELYVMNRPRTGSAGFDLFVPAQSLAAVTDRLITAAREIGGRACGWEAFEIARIEAGIPRFGADMDETNLPPEAGLDETAISYGKGCYIGQEVIARIRTYGQVAKRLRGLKFSEDPGTLPVKGDKLFHHGKEVGYITSAVKSPTLGNVIGLGYVRREANEIGYELTVKTASGETRAAIVELPFC